MVKQARVDYGDTACNEPQPTLYFKRIRTFVDFIQGEDYNMEENNELGMKNLED